MESSLDINENEHLELAGQAYKVLSVTDLGTRKVHLDSKCQWGTHILTLENEDDGARYAATRYASGEISDPFPIVF